MEIRLVFQDVIFPLVNLAACSFTLGVSWWHLKQVGYLPGTISFSLPIVAWFALTYLLFLAGIVEQPGVLLRGPLAVLLIVPGIVAYMDARRRLRV